MLISRSIGMIMPSIYFRAFTSPATVIRTLADHPQAANLGIRFMLIPIIAYTMMYVFLVIGNGAQSVFTPWLNIPKEDYYWWNRFLLAPSMLLAWAAVSVFIHFLARSADKKISFDSTFAAIGLSISVAMWGGLIHDLPMSFFSATGVIDARQHEIDMNSPTIWRTLLWIAYSIYLLAFLFYFSLSVRVVHGRSWLLSIVTGLCGFILFQLIFLVFNR